MRQGDIIDLITASPYASGVAYEKGSETSAAAGLSVRGVLGEMRKQILEWIAARPEGATSDEVEIALNLRHQSASARIRELVLLGYLEPGEKRKTSSGRGAVVYRAKRAAGEGTYGR